MGMTEPSFFEQSIILWNDRLRGFAEMHGGGGSGDDSFTKKDLERLEAECGDSPPTPALAR